MASRIPIGLVIGQLSQGGAERQITRLAVELAKRTSFEPIVFCLSAYTDPYGDELTQAGIQWYAPKNNLKSVFLKSIWLMEQVKATQCRLLYGFLHVGNIYAGMVAFFRGIPFIASIRSATSDFFPLIKILSRFFLNRANMVVGNSASCLQILHQELKVTHRRVMVIPNIIMPMKISKDSRAMLRNRWGITTEPIIGTVALVKKDKRPELFIETCVELNKRLSAHFVWVGDGPEMRWLKSRIALLDPILQSRIHLEGFQENIASYLSAFDIFILTSAYEGSSNALLEAMSGKVACVAPCVPGIVDTLSLSSDKPIGVLCDPHSPQEFAKTIAEVWQDQTYMRQLGQNAYNMVQIEYTPESVINRYSQLFNQML